MGQRLNLEIRKRTKTGDKVLANAYYHWSAYTYDAFNLLVQAHTFLTLNKNIIKDEKLRAIRALESTGAGLPEYDNGDGDLIRIKNMAKYRSTSFNKCTGRNNGIIGCFPDSIKSTEDWAEGTATIYIDDLSFIFDVWSSYETVDDILEWDEDFKEEEVIIIPYDRDDMSIAELQEVINYLLTGKTVMLNDFYIQGIM